MSDLIYSKKNTEKIPIFGVYFICCINNYLDIVKEQLDILNKGLLEITKHLIIFITKYDKNNCSELDIILNTYNHNNKLKHKHKH